MILAAGSGGKSGERALVQCFGSYDWMLPNSARLHVLLTVLLFQVTERKYNGWASLKPAQTLYLSVKISCQDILDCTFVEGRQCK